MKFGNKIPGFKDMYYTSTKIAENKDHNKVLQLFSGNKLIATFSPYYNSGADNTWRLDSVDVDKGGIVLDPYGNYVNTAEGIDITNKTEIETFFNSMIKQFKLKSISFGEKTKSNTGFTFVTPQREV